MLLRNVLSRYSLNTCLYHAELDEQHGSVKQWLCIQWSGIIDDQPLKSIKAFHSHDKTQQKFQPADECDGWPCVMIQGLSHRTLGKVTFILKISYLDIFLRYMAKDYHWKGMETLITRFLGPTWGPSGADRTQVGPMLAPWTLSSGNVCVPGDHIYDKSTLDEVMAWCHQAPSHYLIQGWPRIIKPYGITGPLS